MSADMSLRYIAMDSWPKLGWVARCRPDSSEVTVFHGPHVETTPDWFCEAVWAGAYAEGGFDETSLVAGTGGRRRADGLCFVSSGSTVDRLCTLQRAGATWIANTLAGLLAMVRGWPVRSHPHYLRDFETLAQGLHRYKRFVETSAGPVQLVYFDNLRWDGRTLTRALKPAESARFDTFAAYRTFLSASLAATARNMAAAERRHPYRMLGTVSRGYDSPTVLTLAREVGCQDAITFTQARGGADDSGEPIATILGVRTNPIEREAWRRLSMPEIPFFAAEAAGEDVVLAPAAGLLANGVLLTGYHGDRVWRIYDTPPDPSLERGDCGGLSLTEFRLSVGFIHLPLPFWGARRIAEINTISRSDEMRRWRLGTDYDRPICRRIVEEAGVPRELFGFSKAAVSVNLRSFPEFLTDRSLEDYLGWMRHHRRDWLSAARLPPLASWRWDLFLRRATNWIADRADGVRWRAARVPAMSWIAGNPVLRYVIGLKHKPLYLRRYTFAWAVEKLKAQYPSA
jgi:hypothetical protein